MSHNFENQALPSLLDSFLNYLEVEKGSSPLTIRNYRLYLGRFVKWGQENNFYSRPSEVDNEAVHHYRLWLARLPDGKGDFLSRRTQSYHMIALRSFLKWMNKNGLNVLAADNIDLPKLAERQVNHLSGEQVDRLLSAPSMSSIIGKRDKAILEVLFSTGLRVSELAKLDRDKLDLERREFGIIGKGGRARVVFLSKRAVDWLDAYLKARKDHFKPLFVRHSGKVDPSSSDDEVRLTTRSIQRMVKKYARKMKLPLEVTPHILRHSFATDLLQAGADLRSVQEMLGHKNVTTTQIYTHVTNKQLKDIHEKFHSHNE